MLKTYYESVRLERPLSEDEVIELFHSDFAQAVIEDPYQRELYERQGVQQLRDFLTIAKRGATPRVLHTEERFEVKVGTATVVGRIDRIDDLGNGRVVIVDYKTGKPRAQEDADDSLQLSIYAMAAREKWGYEAERLVFYNFEENRSIATRRDRLQLEGARAKVEDVARPGTGRRLRSNPRLSLPVLLLSQSLPGHGKVSPQYFVQHPRREQLNGPSQKTLGDALSVPHLPF